MASIEKSLNTATRIVAGDDGTNYDNVAVMLHWATAILVLVNFTLAHSWDWFAEPTEELMENAHMTVGVLLTAVILARIAWRLIPGHQVPALTAGWTRLASKAVHYTLYALLLVEAALGFAFRWGAGRPMTFFMTGIPSPIGEIARPMRRQLRDLHEWIGWAIVIIALLHALAALYHHYVVRDRVLLRMLPGKLAAARRDH